MTKHRMSKSLEYRTWLRMKGMCYNEKHPSYKAYGKRGIKMDKSWLESFMNFLSDVGKAPEWATGCELVDLNNDFSKHNFRWVNSQNRRQLKEMPNQRNRKVKKKYQDPRRMVITFEKPYFEFLQKIAIEKSRELGRQVSMAEFTRTIIEKECPMNKQQELKF